MNNENCRISLIERSEVASKLRRHILSREDPSRLESIEDPNLAPHPILIGPYAFEFFLDRYRKKFQESFISMLDYNVDWCSTTLMKDEQTRSNERIARMSANIFMVEMIDEEHIEMTVDAFVSKECFGEEFISRKLIIAFIYEVFYELSQELSRQLAQRPIGSK